MKLSNPQAILIFLVGALIGIFFAKRGQYEGFTSGQCGGCKKPMPCGCPEPRVVCPPCREPDLSQYVLKATVPPCPKCPDLSQYMLKTECPSVPDLSQYVLKSSIPRQQPVILDCSKCKKPSGECPPCPRPRCPEVKCPEPTKCPPCAPCARAECPPAVVKCRAEEVPSNPGRSIRPFLAPLSVSGYGN